MNASVDGTDFRIDEPSPFSAIWYSQKFLEEGPRYKVGLSIQNVYIVWIAGPFPVGSWLDLKMFQNYVKTSLQPEERVIACATYKNECCILPHEALQTNIVSRIRARHETANRRLKQFAVLGANFRHKIQCRIL